eukprot:1954488-Rhodomonas_salina.2
METQLHRDSAVRGVLGIRMRRSVVGVRGKSYSSTVPAMHTKTEGLAKTLLKPCRRRGSVWVPEQTELQEVGNEIQMSFGVSC